MTVQKNPVHALARKLGYFTLTPDTLRQPDVHAALRGLQADVAVVVAYGLIIPASLLNAFPHGWVNAHASLLPRWRGASPIQHALLSGDAVTGVTLMRIDAGMDTGPTFASQELPISPTITTHELSTFLAELSARLLAQHLIPYLKGERTPEPQPAEGVTTARKLTHEDGQLLFHQPAASLERKVRALVPWPGTYFSWNNKDVKILKVTVVPDKGLPGSIAHHPLGFAVRTPQDALVVQQVQVPGKAPIDAHAFLRGYPAFLKVTLP